MMMDGKSVVRRRDARAGDLREERESKGKHMKKKKKRNLRMSGPCGFITTNVTKKKKINFILINFFHHSI